MARAPHTTAAGGRCSLDNGLMAGARDRVSDSNAGTCGIAQLGTAQHSRVQDMLQRPAHLPCGLRKAHPAGGWAADRALQQAASISSSDSNAVVCVDLLVQAR